MISYRQYRREAIAAWEAAPSRREYYAGVLYRVRARAVHRVGLHTWSSWICPQPFAGWIRHCAWCGKTQRRP